MTRLSLFVAVIISMFSAGAFATPKNNTTSIKKAYAAALLKPQAKLTSTFIPLQPQPLSLYRAHKAGERNPAVVVLNGKSAAAKNTFAIVANTERFGLIAVFDRESQQPLLKGSMYIGPNAKKKAEVKWFDGAAPAAAPAAQ